MKRNEEQQVRKYFLVWFALLLLLLSGFRFSVWGCQRKMQIPAPCKRVADKAAEVLRTCQSPGQDRNGWLILCAVMFLTVIRSGTTYSFGEIITDLIHTFPNHTMAELSKCCSAFLVSLS